MPPPKLIIVLVQEGAAHADTDVEVPWWSYTKTVLASAALALVAEGSLQLGEPIRGRPFTLRQLLQHRAELRCYGNLRAYRAAIGAAEPP